MKPPAVCEKCGKLTFASKTAAEEAAYRLRHDHGTRLYAYEDHGAWHLTTDPPRRKGRRGAG